MLLLEKDDLRYLQQLEKPFYSFLLSLASNNKNPIIIELDIKDEPPYEIKGKVIPLVGIIFKADEMFIITWKIKIFDKPVKDVIMKKLFDL